MKKKFLMLLAGLLFCATAIAAPVTLTGTALIDEEPVPVVAGSLDVLPAYIDVTVAIGSGSGRPGDVVAIPISISDIGSREVFSADLVLTYDDALIEAVQVDKGGLTTDWSLAANYGVAGEVRIALYHIAALASGGGELCQIVFNVR